MATASDPDETPSQHAVADSVTPDNSVETPKATVRKAATARTAAARSTAAKTAAAQSGAAKTPAAKTTAARKPAAAKTPASRTTAAKTTAAKTTAAKTTAAKTAAAKTAAAKTTPAKTTAAAKAAATKTTPARTTASKTAAAKSTAAKTSTPRTPRAPRTTTPLTTSTRAAAKPTTAADGTAIEGLPADPSLTAEEITEALAEIKHHNGVVSDAEIVGEASGGGPTDVDVVVDVDEVVADEVVVAEVEDEKSTEVELVEASTDLVMQPGSVASDAMLLIRGLTKRFGDTVAVDGIDLEVRPGAFYGIVGPNGAGKTTTLSMVTGLLRPDGGTVLVDGADVWKNPEAAKRRMGVLPDRLRLFDRLTGAQLLYYAGVLRGLSSTVTRERTADLASVFGLEDALGRLVSDYSAGMTKKIALAAAMIHAPRLLVLDEPFETVDPVSANTVTRVLTRYVASGGTVLLSSHGMEFVQRVCDHVAVVVDGAILADGTLDDVRAGRTLEERFVELAGGSTSEEGLAWLHSYSD